MITMAERRKLGVLLVEDNPGDILLTREALKDNGMANILAIARDGEEAMQYLRKQDSFSNAMTPDIILLDLNLPRLDGREVLGEIRKDPNLRTIPVIILTSSEAESDIRQAYDLSANCYIVKPAVGEKYFEAVQAIRHFWMELAKLPRQKDKH